MDLWTVGVTILITATAFLVLTEVAKRLYVGQLSQLLEQGSVHEYLATLDKPIVKLIFPLWNRLFMQFNGYLALDDYAHADRVAARLLGMRQSAAQRREIVGKAFNYYLERGNAQGAEDLLHEIEGWDDAEAVENARMMFDIYIRHGWSYIDEMEARLSGLSGVDRGLLELLLAVQYENKGDAATSERYLKSSGRHMAMPAKG